MNKMMAQGSSKPLSLGMGKFGPAWIATILLLFGIFAFGVYCYVYQLIHGDTVTGMRSIGSGGAVWGLYIVFVVVFIGVSFAGITISAVIRLFGIHYLKPIARMAELVTIIALSLGACCILADLGRPLAGLLNLPRYARVMSPFFGTFTLVVSGYLFASVVYFYLSGRPDAAYLLKRSNFFPLRLYYRVWAFGFKGTPDDYNRHANSSFWLSLFILPLLITAHSTLGFIFGIQASRPGWYSALQAPGFVVMAGISGTGVILIIAALIRNRLHLEEVITEKCFKWLGLLLMILSVVYLYFMVVEELTAHYAAPEIEMEVAHQLVSGAYAPFFWTTVGGLVLGFLIIFYQYVRGHTSIWMHVTAGVVVNIAAVAKRFIIVVPSQTHGTMLPYIEGVYYPTWVEIGVVMGLVAMGTLIYLGFMKIFPIVPLQIIGDHEEPLLQVKLHESRESHIRRLICFALTLALGLSLVAVGFLLSARYGIDPNGDPLIPFSPVIFITGVMTCFISAIIYEIVPEIT
jgi:molybdopterin-containing oxidoreductase family membrane subunit